MKLATEIAMKSTLPWAQPPWTFNFHTQTRSAKPSPSNPNPTKSLVIWMLSNTPASIKPCDLELNKVFGLFPVAAPLKTAESFPQICGRNKVQKHLSDRRKVFSKFQIFVFPKKENQTQAFHASWDVDLMNWNSALSMDHLLNLSPKTSPQNVPRIQSPKKPVVFATDRYLEPTWNQYTKLLTKSFPIKRQFHNPLWGITRWSSTMPPQTVAAFGPNPSNNPVQTPCF